MAGLSVQSLDTLDLDKMTPLSQDVISRQATINIGTIGHVAHGKSTVVRGLTGVQTTKFKQEKERTITIKLGYANAKIYRCTHPDCPRPGNYTSHGSAHPDRYTDERGWEWVLERHVSFVDCPGHDILMATMLNGAAVMDAAMLLVAANESCPQPQTAEHLAAIEIMALKNLIILQNKVELVNENQAMLQQEEIRKFVSGSSADGAPLIPISAVLKYNLDIVAEYLCTQIPVPVRDFTSKPRMIIIRSFDVNKPGQEIEDLQGGVAGGSILKGVLRLGDEIEIRPGIPSKETDPKTGLSRFKCTPIRSRVTSLHADNNELQYAAPGGLIGVGTMMDPTLTKGDWLVGQVLGHPDSLPDVYDTIDVSYTLMRRLLGVKGGTKIEKLKKGEVLMVNIGSTQAGATVAGTKEESSLAKLELTKPVCAQVGDKIAISRRHDKHWRLIGYGEIVKGRKVELD